MTVSPELRLLAEETFFVVPTPPGANRIVTDRYVMHAPDSPGQRAFAGAGRLRMREDEVDEVVAEVRGRAAERGRNWVTWWVGPSATPADIGERLRAKGVVPLDDPSAEPRYTALVLVDEPPEAPPEIEARRVRDLTEYSSAYDVYWEVAEPERAHTVDRSGDATMYEQRHLSGGAVAYLAWSDGEPAGMALSAPRPEGAAIVGGYVLPRFRGRGVYRALVRARWEDAASWGDRALAGLGGAMSGPILQRVGFTSLGTVDVLYDEFG